MPICLLPFCKPFLAHTCTHIAQKLWCGVQAPALACAPTHFFKIFSNFFFEFYIFLKIKGVFFTKNDCASRTSAHKRVARMHTKGLRLYDFVNENKSKSTFLHRPKFWLSLNVVSPTLSVTNHLPLRDKVRFEPKWHFLLPDTFKCKTKSVQTLSVKTLAVTRHFQA